MMRFVAVAVAAQLLCAGWVPAEAQARNGTDSRQYLFVWAGAADSTRSDFLAVIDATPRPTRYGDVIATIPVGAVTMAHHVELANDRLLLANGFNAGTTFRFDLQDPRNPLLAGTLPVPENLAHPHSFVRLANGHVLATYQYQTDDHGLPGGLAEHDARGDVIRWKSAIDPAVPDFFRPYSLVTVPALDRIVVTGVDMHGQGLSRVVQVWRLSDLVLIKSLLLPDGPRGDEGLQSFEPRLLQDGRTVVVSTLRCGLYRIDGLEGESPSAALIHTFADQRCDMPAVIGRFWVQTLSTNHALVSLDMSDPTRPVEVARLDLGADNRPHWLAPEPGGNRIVLTGYRDLQYRVMLLDLDPTTGKLSVDAAFRDGGSAEAGVSFNRVQWPHGAGGPARPHGAVFLLQQSMAADPVCRLTPIEEQWVGPCGALLGGEPTLAISPAPSVTTGTWRPSAEPIAVWAGEMRFEAGALPVEIEIHADGSGVLRSGVSWIPVKQLVRVGDTLQLHLDASRPVPPSELDPHIVRRAAEIISSDSVWDRADDRKCESDDRTWSIYCALHRATIEITGGFHHRRPALQAVRQVINERSAGRKYSHRIQDYNNDPTTRLADVHAVFAEAEARMRRESR